MKVNWSVLTAFEKKDYERVAQNYFDLDGYKFPAMIKGIEKHKVVADEKIKLLPCITDTAIFEDKPNGIGYYIIEINGDKVSCVLDCHDKVKKFIIDWKFSTKKASQQDIRQLYFYAWLLKSIGIEMKDGYMVVVSDNFEVKDMVMVDLSNEKKLEAIGEWYNKTLSELKQYIISEWGIEP